MQEAVNLFFTLPVFVLLGLTLPWQKWGELGWRGVILVVAVLLLRRLPAMMVLRPLLGRGKAVPDALFMGWFGPVGMVAIFYVSLARGRTEVEEAWVIGSLVICGSLLAHGLTSSPFTRWYGPRAGKGTDTDEDPTHWATAIRSTTASSVRRASPSVHGTGPSSSNRWV